MNSDPNRTLKLRVRIFLHRYLSAVYEHDLSRHDETLKAVVEARQPLRNISIDIASASDGYRDEALELLMSAIEAHPSEELEAVIKMHFARSLEYYDLKNLSDMYPAKRPRKWKAVSA
ncbi:hypothetical protein [Rhizobium sp. L245/93]|uniref:hypothetical protein n=1 Tax=Rhizobium sp. L245/93 TaxID=2819998 RepID=UPI001ADCECDE|nr:hypothetical protein [Rhizobium sp. L245/93]MBO9170882.1 hypothetical protein [Rhizobium sp. L245/93]